MIRISDFGTLASGEKIGLFTLENENMKLLLSEFGANMVRLQFKGKDVILGYDTLEDYLTRGDYFGAVVGRVANRIGGGKFTLNGKEYILNKNFCNSSTLHGGNVGFNSVKWTGRAFDNENAVEFSYLAKDMEEGFPGNLAVTVKYTLLPDGVRLEYRAKGDKDTVVNLSNHAYFNLSGGREPVTGHYLTISADAFTAVDDVFVPTGEIIKVKGTPFDFNERKLIGKDIDKPDEQLAFAGGYDHNYILKGEGFRKVATAECTESGVTMDCYTDMPGMQFYSGNMLNKRKIFDGIEADWRYALCLETQFFPNAVNIPSFPSITLKAGDEYASKTEYRFSALAR